MRIHLLRRGRWGRVDAPLLALAGLYFLNYMGVGLHLPYLNLHFLRIGLGGAEIGLINAVLPLGAIVGPPLIASFADARGNLRGIIAGLLVISGLTFCVAVLATAPIGIVPVMFVFGLAYRSVPPLIDTLAMERVTTQKATYGRLRMWGSIGFVVTALSGGFLAAYIGLQPVLLLFLACALAAAVCCRFLPATAPPPTRRSVWTGLSGLSRARLGGNFHRFAAILVAAQLAGVTQNMFFAIRMDQLGQSEAFTGIAFLIATVGEVLMLWHVDKIINRIGPRATIALGLAGGALRWALTAVLVDPFLLVAIQSLHAFSFAAVHVGMVRFIALEVPDTSRATGQAVLTGARAAMAGVVGSFLFGYLFDFWSLTTLYVLSAAVAAAAAVAMFTLVRDPAAQRSGAAKTA